jgi:A/G-specific adenine glycosylase
VLIYLLFLQNKLFLLKKYKQISNIGSYLVLILSRIIYLRRNMKKIFTRKLLGWHFKENKRTMPWKGEKDPYKIWISEIILQQTRVSQGLEYYNNFIKEFPAVKNLALASEESVFKIWEGLGYYTRCKNIIFTAKHIFNDLDGKFPSAYNEIIALKGIGPYTAAAISSFAYGLPHAVADGNVFRVLSRYFGETLPVDSPGGKEYFTRLANELLYKKNPAAFNQAIMDFGATVCKPQIPTCSQCIFQKNCIAYNEGMVNKLPVKEKQLVRKKRWFTYFMFTAEDKILINKRTGKDIWQNLYEFYLFETAKERAWKNKEIEQWLHDQLNIENFTINNISPVFTQQLTHQHLQGRFIDISLYQVPDALRHFTAINKNNLQSFAFPKFINQYLQQTKTV